MVLPRGQRRVLVVAAHPDDEILGCGGTIARRAREGERVHILILGEGVTSRYRKRDDADPKLVQVLQSHGRAAAKIIGAASVSFEHLPDNRFDTVPLLDVVKIVEDSVNRLRPEVVYTHHPGDLNIDHQVTQRSVLTATRPIRGHPTKEILAFEIASSTEWAFQRSNAAFQPNVFVDISKTLQVKLRALARYETEMRTFPHPRSPEALEAIARRWGSVVGCGAAEAFELVRAVV